MMKNLKTPLYIGMFVALSMPTLVITDTVNPNYQTVRDQFGVGNSIKQSVENQIQKINKKEQKPLFLQVNNEQKSCQTPEEKPEKQTYLTPEELSMIQNNSEKLDKEIETLDNLNISQAVSYQIRDILSLADIPQLRFAKAKPIKKIDKNFKFTTYVSLAEISYEE